MSAESSDRFIHERKRAWQRLEELLARLDRSSLRRLHREEVRELGDIYRRTASDLAIARVESRDPQLINYLNNLVIRAHGRIYRAESQGGRRVRQFFVRDFPQTFRRTWRYTALSFLLFLIFGALAFLTTWRDPEFAEVAGIDSYFREVVIKNRTRWWERLNEANQVGASEILTNNIGVTFYAFTLGPTFGLGTLYVLIFNGLMIGAVLALTYQAGYGNELVTFMVGHGVIELSCIFMSCGAGLMLGGAILAPGDLSRADALRLRAVEAVHLIIGSALLLVVAGIIEGFVSPAPINAASKFGVGVLTGLALYA
ncbi:MAG TPA: stage II sporulation protein M, partial [Pyrinomonadaceae bacterium]|nr:stage II sporulation protein M [Pyrinomonadaceae bacterium]